jgi:hypothetical protein
MTSKEIYENSVAALFHKLGGGLADRDVIVAVELFDLLLEREKSIHPDDLKPMYKKAGFDDFTSEKLAQICDFVDVYRKYKGGHEIRHWTDEEIDSLLQN